MAPFGLLDAAGVVMWHGLATIGGFATLVTLITCARKSVAPRRMSISTFGILMISEPGAAAVAGALVLGRPMATSQVVGTVLVAGGGTTRAARG